VSPCPKTQAFGLLRSSSFFECFELPNQLFLLLFPPVGEPLPTACGAGFSDFGWCGSTAECGYWWGRVLYGEEGWLEYILGDPEAMGEEFAEEGCCEGSED
jgi:hypothetical protein